MTVAGGTTSVETVAVTISPADDGPDGILLGVVQVGRAGVQPGSRLRTTPSDLVKGIE